MTQGIVTIKKGREKPIRNQHPWIFSGAIARSENAVPGENVTIVSHRGEFLAKGYWNPASQIQVRILTWQDEAIDEDWWRDKLKRAIDARALNNISYHDGQPIAYRLVNAENDFLPGVIVDRYADFLVVQALTLGIEHRKSMIANILADLLEPKGIFERSDVPARRKEGLETATGVLWGEAPPEQITISKTSVEMLVDVHQGHKTGAYLDQRENHDALFRLLNEDFEESCRLLNLFSYTGSFGLFALGVGGTHVIHVDSSYEALEMAEQNSILNNFHLNEHGQTAEYIQADAFEYLRHCVDEKEAFDIIVLDPPKFAHNKRQINKASRGYKDLNLNAFKIIKPGGYLMTYSCSGAISRDLFQKIVFGALADSGRQAQIIRYLSAGADHPVALTFPEGEYLKGLLLRVY